MIFVINGKKVVWFFLGQVVMLLKSKFGLYIELNGDEGKDKIGN